MKNPVDGDNFCSDGLGGAKAKGFVFTFDALFAAVVSITLALSFYLMLEGIQAQPAKVPFERDFLAALDKTGGLDSVSGEGLRAVLSKNNRCGSLTIKLGGIKENEFIACPCGGSADVYSSSRSFVRFSGGRADYLIATLRTCPGD